MDEIARKLNDAESNYHTLMGFAFASILALIILISNLPFLIVLLPLFLIGIIWIFIKAGKYRYEVYKLKRAAVDTRQVSALVTELYDGGVVASVAEALVKIGEPALGPLIAELSHNKYSQVREAITEILVRIDPAWPRSEAAKSQISTLIGALRNEDPGVRQEAAEVLEKIDPSWPQREEAKREVPEFIAAWRKDNQGIHECATKVLARIGKPALVPLIAAIRDKDLRVHKGASEMIGKIDPDWPRSEAALQQVPEFIAALRDRNEHVREHAAEFLEKVSPDWPQSEAANTQVSKYIAALRDYDRSVRLAAADALRKIRIRDPESIEALAAVVKVGLLSDVEGAVIQALVNAGEAALEPLIAALQDQDGRVRFVAARALGQIEGVGTIEPLIAALRDWDQKARKAAAEALEKIAPNWPQSEAAAHQVPEFIIGLRNGGWDVREICAKALGRIKSPESVSPLIAALRDKSANVRWMANDSLNKITPDWPQSETATQQVPEFIEALQDDDRDVRQAAVEALGRIRDLRSVSPLIAALRDKDTSVRRVVNESLNKITPDWPQSEAVTQQVPEFIEALQDDDRDVRQATAEALAYFRDPRSVEPLIALLRDKDSRVRETAVEALEKVAPNWPQSEAATHQVPEFIVVLQNGELRLRFISAVVLGVVRDNRAIEPLIAALRDKDSHVRDAAADSLEGIDPKWPHSETAMRQVPEFIAVLNATDAKVREVAARMLGAISDSRALEPLIVTLHDEDSRVRTAAAKALGKIANLQVISPLQSAARDQDSTVRGAAVAALEDFKILDQGALEQYPNVMCSSCGLRAASKTYTEGPRTQNWVGCRGCGTMSLLVGIKRITGLIGGAGEDFRQAGSVVTVRLWNETDQTARNADIDRLVIRAGGVSNYERAVNSVINVLHGDVSRPPTWCKKIPVILEGSPVLSVGTVRMLEDTFSEVRAENCVS